MKHLWLMTVALAASVAAGAENIPVNTLRHAGPYPVMKPLMVDEVDVNTKPFGADRLLSTPISSEALKNARTFTAGTITPAGGDYSVGLLSFRFRNSAYTHATVKVDGLDNYSVTLDGAGLHGRAALEPGSHRVEIKYVISKADAVSVSIDSERDGIITLEEPGSKRLYNMQDVLLGTRFSGVSLSRDGKYLVTSYTTAFEGGRTSRTSKLTEVATGKMIAERAGGLSWMPLSNRCWYTRTTPQGRDIVVLDPATNSETVFAANVPDGYFRISPDETMLIYSVSEEGPSEKKEIYQIIEPDDRQPGWRSRSHVEIYDIATGVMRPVTFGYHNSYCNDISADGRYALIQASESRLTARPTTVSTLYLLDLATMESRVLVDRDGFMGGASFSPDGKSVLLSGSPEAFGAVGMAVEPGKTPSLTDTQLYVMDLASGGIRPITKEFDPCVTDWSWNNRDGKIYLTAENRDYVSIFRIDPVTAKYEQINTEEDVIKGMSVAEDAPVMAYFGQGASNSDRLYLVDLKKNRTTLREDLSKDILKDVELGECHEWTFTNSIGDTIYGRYYLPPHFDPSKKYPMIVNYYGGCSPTSRNFESRYPHNLYAAMGYVVYIVEPSGATGFGQKFSSRHVNTAGEDPARDIIEGTKQFCREHDFVNPDKIGCIGASYGGFMSQYIPTLTDMFATAISHAGISDHTGYWGEGYWGYSYSETSMANSYPWSETDLFVKHSPLYNVEKIHTPILLLHGDGDTNVPFSESIQMYTALKLLGREAAFVAVTGENHHIVDYEKRIMWQNTIFAWFAKYLQDDPEWWDELYAPKSL